MNQQIDWRAYIENWLQRNPRIPIPLEDVTIHEKIGEGGSSVVYSCTWPGCLHSYGAAIKFLIRPESPKYVKRFKDEYYKSIGIAHDDTIAPLYGIGIQDMDGKKVPYIIMERCKHTLEDIYREKKLVDAGELRALLDRLLEILKKLHDAGIIHRDIKPSNILQRSNGKWVLNDLGIAWFDPSTYEKLVETGKDERLANFDFSAPEQRIRSAYDNPTCSMDIYALGQTLYYLVTGRTIKGTNHRLLGDSFPALSKYDVLINKMVRQEPSERFQSVEETQAFLSKLEQRKKRTPRTKTEISKRQRTLFDEALQSVSRHPRGYYRIGSKEEINELMSSLAGCSKKCNLSWIVGYEKGPVGPIEKCLQENGWLIGPYECNISNGIIYRDYSIPLLYVLLQLAPLPRFEKDSSENANYSFARYFNEKYITQQEFIDKRATINGKSVTIKNAQPRRRNLKTDFIFLIPQTDPFNQEAHQQQIYSVYEDLRKSGEIDCRKLQYFKGMIMCANAQSSPIREEREVAVVGPT